MSEGEILNPSNVVDPNATGINKAPAPEASKGPPAPNEEPDGNGGAPLKEGPSDRAKRLAAEAAAKEAEAIAAEKAGKKAEPKVEEKTEKEEEKTEVEEKEIEYSYDNLGIDDPSVNSVIDLLKEAKVPPVEADAIFSEAIQKGDLTKIKWDLLEAKLGKAKASLVKTGVNDYYNRVYVKNVQTKTSAYEAVGGEENWNKVAKWVKATEKADPSQKETFDAIRQGIDAGGKLAAMAVKELKSLYEADAKNSGLKGTKGLTQGNRNVTTGGEPLSKKAYLELMHKAHSDGAIATVIEQLRARRRAGMQAGL